MSKTTYFDMWKFTNQYNFNINYKLHNDLICIICKKILQVACQSPCGCRYCYQCIVQYLNEEDKCCPNQFNECKKLNLNLHRDISVDHIANKRILDIKVKCPDPCCDFTDELRNVLEHINSHEIKCPFNDLGCNKLKNDSGNLKNHLIESTNSHTISTIDSIQAVKKDVTFLKENVYKKNAIIDKLKHETELLKFEMINLKNQEIEVLKREIEILKKGFLQKENSIMNQNYNENKENPQKKILRCKRKVLQVRPSTDSKRPFYSEVIDDDWNSNDPPGIELSRNYSGFQPNFLPFIWKINNFLKQKKADANKTGADKFISSGSFYSHERGYQMCLLVDPNGYPVGEFTHLSVYVGVIEGEYDDLLPWPMTRDVTVSLLDQTTSLDYVSVTYKYDAMGKNKFIFDRPSLRSDDNNYFCEMVLINMNAIIHNEKVLSGGSIVLKCVMK